jgi:phosphoribosyl-ATP pyrophosphohydrolase
MLVRGSAPDRGGTVNGQFLFTSPTLGRGKLVRDNVGFRILQEPDGAGKLSTLPEDEIEDALLRKLFEESEEVVVAMRQRYSAAKALKHELGDVFSVLSALAARASMYPAEIMVASQQRDVYAGTFARRFFLKAPQPTLTDAFTLFNDSPLVRELVREVRDLLNNETCSCRTVTPGDPCPRCLVSLEDMRRVLAKYPEEE